MAVTDMQKLTVIGLNSSRTPFLHELMRLGVVEINSQEGVVNDEMCIRDSHEDMNGQDQLDKVINIDQSPIGRTPRSNPATYTCLLYTSHWLRPLTISFMAA